jgi:type II secretory pathway pseudopilin PulG
MERPTQIRPPRCKGFTYLELVVVIILISTLLYFAMDRLLQLQATAEKAAIEQTVGAVQSAIAMQIAGHIAKGRIPALQGLVGTNPFELLAERPKQYRVVKGPEAEREVAPGTWYYDTASHTLGYRVVNRKYFRTTGPLADHIKFKLLAVYDDSNGNGRRDADEPLQGLRLGTLYAFSWSVKPVTDPAMPTGAPTDRTATRLEQ